ncbi:MAG: hypothetical protein M0R05_03885 [Bacilli bacterium]|nr:hypothetical protein [Bacilli bacterium]MDD4387854.1 hypothetical protein [Bacilli bacterium]
MKKKVIFNYPNLILLFITVISVWLIIYFIKRNIFNYKFLATFLFFGLAWLAVVVSKIFKIKIPSVIIISYYFFLILSLFFGVILGFYFIFPWYDDFNHFLAGALLTLFGIFIIAKLDNVGYLKFSLLLTYSLFFAGFCGGLWEIIEFMIDRVFNYDIQRVGTTGVANTIVDLIMNLLGSIIIVFLLIIDDKVYKNKYLEKLLKKYGE